MHIIQSGVVHDGLEIFTARHADRNRRFAGDVGTQGCPRRAAAPQTPATAPSTTQEQTRAQRMQWWHAARFGMFVHFGVYSSIERHEWVMEDEAIPLAQYTPHAATFRPKPNSARAWAKLAKAGGMKYMVMTTKHHEGFCNFDTKLTSYCAPKQGAGRDLVREYVEAARAEGLHVGFYYSLGVTKVGREEEEADAEVDCGRGGSRLPGDGKPIE